MFTPQRRQSSATAITYRREVRNSGGADADSKIGGKGKAVAVIDGHGSMSSPAPPPPVMSLGGNGAVMQDDNMEDWMRFREAGLLDEAVMERKDREALLQKAAELEKELYDYQYAMGLLLIEKKEWNSKFDELSQALAEAKEIFKREQAAHIIAYSEAEEREENFRKALSAEKQKSTELQKVLRELQEERAQIKNSSESNLADAKALAVGVEERSVEVEARLGAAEAKLDEINRKNLELDRELEELEARESVLQRERLSLNAEKEAHQASFYKQREDLLEWERKLQKGEEKLRERQKILNQKEEMVKETEKVIEQKGMDLEEAEKKITSSSAKLKEKRDDINNQLSDLAVKEKSADSARRVLQRKEEDLVSLEEKLRTRENMEVEKIVDECRATLDTEIQELELELREKDKNLEEELRNKVAALRQQEAEILHSEEKLRKREQALDKKSERVKEKEKDIESRLKSVKGTQKSVNAEQKKLELEQKKLLSERESLLDLKNECEKIRSEISQQEIQIGEERENVKVTDDERLEHLRMQAELKQELEKCKLQEDYLLKEGEELKQDREKFEKELEVLEGKRDELTKELKEITKEKEKLEKQRRSEEENMKKKRIKMEESIKKELEALRVAKESFELKKKRDQEALSELAATLHDQTVQEFKPQRSNFEMEMRSRREELEKELLERERSFETNRERELDDLKHLKDAATKELEEIQSQRRAIEKEKLEVVKSKEDVERQQLGMRKDIDELAEVSDTLRRQREQVMREKNHFIALVKKHKSCSNCGDIVGEFILSDLLPPDIGDKELAFLQGKAANYASNNQGASVSPELGSKSGERVSWFRKYASKIFKSPTKKFDDVSASTLPEEKIDDTIRDCSDTENKPKDLGSPKVKDSRLKFRRRRGISKTQPVKQAVDDLDNVDNNTNHISDESRGISLHKESPSNNSGRKRDREATESQQTGGNSDGYSESVSTLGRKKRRQTVAPVVTPGQTRYNLRRHKPASEVKTKGKEIVDSAAEEVRPTPGTALGVASETGKSSYLVKVTTVKDTSILHDNREDKLNSATIVEHVEEERTVEIAEVSEEVNSGAQCGDEDDNGSVMHDDDDDDGDDHDDDGSSDDDDDFDPGEASMGKKIWNFFTS